MPKPNPLRDASEQAARLAYSESELSEQGEEMKATWEEDASEAVEDELGPEYWSSVVGAVERCIRQTEGVVAGLKAWRASEELDPIEGEEGLRAYLKSEPWDLALLGKLSGFKITVWSHPAFEGALAIAVAEDADEEGVSLGTPTSLA